MRFTLLTFASALSLTGCFGGDHTTRDFSARRGYLHGDLGSLEDVEGPADVSGWSDPACIDFFITFRQGDRQANLMLALHPDGDGYEDGDVLELADSYGATVLTASVTPPLGNDTSTPVGGETEHFWVSNGQLRVTAGSTPDRRRVDVWAHVRQVDGYDLDHYPEQRIDTGFELDAVHLTLPSSGW